MKAKLQRKPSVGPQGVSSAPHKLQGRLLEVHVIEMVRRACLRSRSAGLCAVWRLACVRCCVEKLFWAWNYSWSNGSVKYFRAGQYSSITIPVPAHPQEPITSDNNLNLDAGTCKTFTSRLIFYFVALYQDITISRYRKIPFVFFMRITLETLKESRQTMRYYCNTCLQTGVA